jgi:hypothetical protein
MLADRRGRRAIRREDALGRKYLVGHLIKYNKAGSFFSEEKKFSALFPL